MCIKHVNVASGDTAVHIKGQAWQSYLVFGQAGTLSIVDSKASFEPVVTKVSGSTITAKSVDGNGSIDLNVQTSSAKIVAISYRSFTMTAE